MATTEISKTSKNKSVFQTFADFLKDTWKEDILCQLGGEHVQSSETSYMLWLGQKRAIFGVEGSNAAWIAYHVFQSLLEE